MANNKKNNQKKNNPKFRKDAARYERTNSSGHYANGHCGEENDPGWYNRLRTLVKDVTKVPFTFQIGRPLEYSNEEGTLSYDTKSTPGVMVLDYVTCPGLATVASDGANIAATALFQKLRKDLSTYAPYASADVMMYVLAGDMLIILYNFILRMFGVVNVYSSINYNINASILKALGMSESDQVDFKSNLNSYRSRFNNLIYKASTIYIPSEFAIIERHAWLFSNVFTDANSVKGQIYLHDLAGIHILDETSSEQGTMLKFYTKEELAQANPNVPYMELLLNLFDQMIERFRNSDSMNKIAADMRRAYSDMQAWRFAYCDENYNVPFVYSQEVLSQIENTTLLPSALHITPGSLDITQSVDKNIILFNPSWDSDESEAIMLEGVDPNGWDNNQLINAHVMEPTQDDIAVMTRNVVNLEYDAGTDKFRPTSLGSDFVIKCRMYAWNTRAGSVQTRDKVTRFMTLPSQNSPLSAETIGVSGIGDYISFDWAPMLFICESADESLPLTAARPLIDYNNYTFISPETLDNIHNNIITSMWSVPQFGDPTK